MTTVRIILALVAALVASVSLNVWQYGSLQASLERDAIADEIARAQGRADALAETLRTGAALAEFAQLDQARLLLDLRAIADSAKERVTVYRDRIRTLPPLACAPGAERMDALNHILEATP